MALTPEDIRTRMVEWRNLKKLHKAQKIRIQLLQEENMLLKARVAFLEAGYEEQQRINTNLRLQVEELRTMVFGKKTRTTKDDEPKEPPTSRTHDSYHRPLPKEDEVTDTQSHPCTECTHCHGTLTSTQEVVYYVEDIPLPLQKMVTKHVVEKGYCVTCSRWQTGAPVPSARVIIGERVHAYVAYLSIMGRLSFTQIQQLLFDTYHFALSAGEIAKILKRQALAHRPAYEQLKETIRGAPIVHLDETSWRQLTDGSGSYAWSMSTPEGRSVYLVGESRGRGNVTTLLGDDYAGVVVSDDYGAYRTLTRHQLCWAHVLRKFRDLARSGELDADAQTHHQQEYQTLAGIYQDVRDQRDPSLCAVYVTRLQQLAQHAVLDCKKLRTYKETLLKNIPAYLTCLADPAIPLTNNQAERSLRHLVLKRKVSFGSHSKETAERLAILLSVFMSKRSQNPRDWFGELLQGV